MSAADNARSPTDPTAAPRTSYAHSLATQPPEHWEPLEDHLRTVAGQAASFATKYDAADWPYLAGLWHDVGKYSKEFCHAA